MLKLVTGLLAFGALFVVSGAPAEAGPYGVYSRSYYRGYHGHGYRRYFSYRHTYHHAACGCHSYSYARSYYPAGWYRGKVFVRYRGPYFSRGSSHSRDWGHGYSPGFTYTRQTTYGYGYGGFCR